MKPLFYPLLCILLYHVSYSGTRFAVALYAIQLKATPAMVGVLMALFSLVPMLLGIPVGRLIDKRGARGLMLVCGLALFGGVLMAGLWADINALFLVCILVGGGFYCLYIATQQLMGRYGGPEQRTGNFAWLSSGVAASAVVAPIATGYGIDHAGYGTTFLSLSCLPPLALAVLLAGRIQHLGPTPARAQAGDEAAQATPRRLTDLLGNAEVRRIYAMGMLTTTSWDTFLFLTPLYCSSLGIAPSKIGIIMACYSAATLTIRLFTTTLSRRFHPWQLLILSLTCIGAANFAFGFAASVPLLMLFAFSMGLSQGASGPMINTILFEAAPHGRATEAIGLRVTITKAYQSTLPMVTGTIGTLVGLAPVFWLVSSALLAGAWSVRHKWHRPTAS